jgi:hypothetical protein
MMAVIVFCRSMGPTVQSKLVESIGIATNSRSQAWPTSLGSDQNWAYCLGCWTHFLPVNGMLFRCSYLP